MEHQAPTRILVLIFVILIIAQESYSLECKDVDKKKCLCFNFDNTDIQCPPQDPEISLSIRKKKHVTLQCLKGSTPYLDLDIIPAMNIPESKVFRMEYCYLNTSFTNILQKFNMQDLNTLVFESMAQEDNNRNITLSKESFQSLEGLESLTLSYSTIYFATDFLANTPNLVTLSLNRNTMRELDYYFKNLAKLKLLELSGNQIVALPDGIFEDLFNLTKLFLFGNNLTSVSKNTFTGLKNLKLLELSYNHIQELPEDTFADLQNLVNISLRGNKIRNVHSNTFAKNNLLENIRLGNNNGVTLSDYVFANLRGLRTVELFLNNLEMVPENSFKNCENLEEITLKHNQLTSLPESLFKGLKNLRILDLSENKLNFLPNEVFSSLEKLKELNLSNNQLTVINSLLFKYLDHLQRLDLHENRISTIDLGAFAKLQNALTYLDLSANRWNNSYIILQTAEPLTPLGALIQIEELILSHNEIVEIPSLPSALKLKRMDLGYNHIDYLPIRSFAHSIGFTFEVDLSNNRIEQIDFRLAEFISKENTPLISARGYEEYSTELTLSNNPIVCDCSNYDLIRYNDNEMKELETLVKIKQESLFCSNDNTTKVLDLQPSDIDCPVLNGCPDSCRCSYKPYNTAVVVDCSNNNLTSYPIFNFQIDSYAYSQTFLILSGNNLTKGPAAHQGNYSNITNLDLSNNFITEIDWIPPKIRDLNLDDNLIKNLDNHFVDKLKNATSLKQLHLKGNPWDCNCNALALQNYLTQYFHKVNLSDVYCQNKHVELTKLTNICKLSPYLSILLPILLTVFLCFAVAFALYYRYQTEIKVYLFAKNWCLWFVTEEDMDKDKLYDVFISYVQDNEKFVVEQLVPQLEHGENPISTCIHMRDWIPGEFIAEQVVNSVQNSRRTLVVLSNSFLDSVWGKLEFRTAHTQAITEGRARVIILLLGDLDESKLDDELRSYLKTNTYVKWGDKYFWNQLRYALPHSKNNFYNRNKKHAKVMLKIDDKFDLIKNPPSPSNTSTPPITLDPSLLESKDLRIDITKNVEGETPLIIRQV